MFWLPRNRVFEQSREDAAASAQLSIIVAIHDEPGVTLRCLTSLQRYAPQAEIVLVDDGSKLEETIKLIDEFAARNAWKLIRHVKALGHSAACEAGINLATRPYLCLLNSDTVTTPWCWRPVVQVFEENPDIGVAGPSTSAGGVQTIPLAHLLRHSLNDSQICGYARRILAQPSGGIISDLRWACGFAFFIRRSLWEQLGGFDRNLPDYGNETELCRRVRKAGYRIVWVHNSYIHHFCSMTYGKMAGDESFLRHMRFVREYIQEKHPPRDL